MILNNKELAKQPFIYHPKDKNRMLAGMFEITKDYIARGSITADKISVITIVMHRNDV